MSTDHVIPVHIPESLVRDFDFYNMPGAEKDIHLAWKQLHETAPDIFWTPRNGGHWVATRAEDIEAMQLDHTRFSHAKFNLPDFEFPFPPLPLSLDPPAHGPIRALLSPALSPRAVQTLSCTAREIAIELIDNLAPQGECEFVGQFAKVLPIVVFLGIVGLPFSDADRLMPHADALVRSTDIEQRKAAHGFIHQYLAGWIEKRRAEPGDDLLSKVVTARVGGEPLSHEQVFGLATLALVGGLDTVVSMLSFTAKCLAENPNLRQQLRERLDDKAFLEHAVEELMRRHGLPNTARLITHDFEYKGIQFKQGERFNCPRCFTTWTSGRSPTH